MKYIFKFLLLLNLLSSAFAAPKLISNYQDLVSNLSKGDEVRAIFLINKCTTDQKTANDNNIIAGMNFTQFNKYSIQANNESKNIVATSFSMMTEHSRYGLTYNYIRLRVFEDNSAEILSEYFDPKDFSRLGLIVFNCQLSQEPSQEGVTLYDLSK
jgi:hypothetical protein